MANPEICPGSNVGIGRAGLYEIFAAKGFTKGCEVGVREGNNAYAMLQAIPNLRMILVDPYMVYEYRKFKRRNRWKWDLSTMDRIRFKALRRLAKSNVQWLMTTSAEAARCVADESLDFVYIDGNHSFDFITQDIQYWYPKIRNGGIISGHDYGIRSVRRAVDTFAKYHWSKVSYTDQKLERGGSKTVVSWFMEKKKI
jgi:hypothetical protein